MQAYKFESFTVRHTVSEYHYTLYYYDQAGNLVKTIPPAGVRPNYDSLWLDSVRDARLAGQVKVPAHLLPTQYRYNTLNQVTAQKSPDGGKTEFWYDRLGRLSLSRNARQQAMSSSNNHYFSYTKYDVLGRITEVGQLKDTFTHVVNDTFTRNELTLDNWHDKLLNYREQVTLTIYDTPYDFFGIGPAMTVAQQNVRNRVSYVTYVDTPGLSTSYNHSSFYSYDIHGNVDTLLQDYGLSSTRPNIMNKNGNRWKKFVYEYDLISGKVNKVQYQPGFSDQWAHRYFYDAENRLTEVQTSTDGYVWEKEAKYEYYLHGPLARTILGQQQVQGMDYAYTLQGWLKGVNSTGATATHDIGKDGVVGNINQYVGRDALGFNLNYFLGDYKAINTGVASTFPAYKWTGGGLPDSVHRPLYNGNISGMATHIRMFLSQGHVPLLYNYQYDQLNRLVKQEAYFNFDANANSYTTNWNKNYTFHERFGYDANGNIQNTVRHAITVSGPALMDSLFYNYYPGTNQLRQVIDHVPDNAYGSNSWETIQDLDSQTDDSNYVYDAIGNLVEDRKEGITNIRWNVYGKIMEINRTVTARNNVVKLVYNYDAQGNRIGKVEYQNSGVRHYTWYVRDAQGNLMSTYAAVDSAIGAAPNKLDTLQLSRTERQIYGSSRLGAIHYGSSVDGGPGSSQFFSGGSYERGRRQYELTNHLGNVLTTVSDRKIGVYSNGSLTLPNDSVVAVVDYYEPHMVNATDYYAFGMPSRVASSATGAGYRFGFNGKENDNEVKGYGNQQDYGMRIYDARIGRFLSVDPLTSKYAGFSPYPFAMNSPIAGIDLDGSEFEWYLGEWLEEKLFGSTKLQKIRNGFQKRAKETVVATLDAAKAYGEFQSSLTPMSTALGGRPYAKNVMGEPIEAATRKMLQNIKDMPSLLEMVKGVASDYADLFNKALKGDGEAIGGLAFEAGALFIPFGKAGTGARSARAFKNMSKGFAFFTEGRTYFKNPLAKAFEDGTVGAMSSLETKSRMSPGLFFRNTNVLGNNFVKFDGFQIIGNILELIDRKWTTTTKSKQIADVQRMSEALAQNPIFGSLEIRGIIEVPDEAAFKAAKKTLEKAGVENIEIRIKTDK